MSFRSSVEGGSAHPEGAGLIADRELGAVAGSPIVPDLVVFSHLRWNFVYQRPQHLLSRLARNRRVIFIEEPVRDDAPEAWFEYDEPVPNVQVCVPHTPAASTGFSPEQLEYLRPLVKDLRATQLLGQYVAWFYTPMALSLLEVLSPAAVIYDCMDELSTFLNAPPELIVREQELLGLADVVFTGGPSLYLAKRDRHPNVHCFPSSIDAQHFAQAKPGSETIAEASDQSALARPRLGYFGVIDERLDLALIDSLAESHPDWQVVMVGPVVKIDPATLPRRPNIHYLGQKQYEELPAYLRGWEVCLMPFALNASTKYISPTKVLEYMAAERPIVSTSIRDVAEPYGSFLRIADGAPAFIAACEAAMASSPADRQARLESMRKVISTTSWDATAAAMSDLIDGAFAGRAASSVAPIRASESEAPPVVVIGAGPTGLSAAYHLGEDAVLLEQNDRVGGWCRSIEDGGFTFDFAGHIMFSNDPYVHELYEMLLGDNVHWQDREAWIHSKDVYTRYPFQGALYGLPADVIKECIVGAIEARFGSIRATPPSLEPTADNGHASTNGQRHNGPSSNGSGANGHSAKGHGPNVHGGSNGHGAPQGHGANGHAWSNGHGGSNGHGATNGHSNGHRGLSQADATLVADDRAAGVPSALAVAGHGSALANEENLSVCLAHSIGDCCADGLMESTAPLAVPTMKPESIALTPENLTPENFEEFIYRVWGRGIARHFAIPYNQKLWAVDLKDMETSWLGGRVPMPDIEELIEGSLQPAAKPMGPNARFGYPLRGGFQALMDGFLPHLRGPVHLNARVAEVSPERRMVTLADGRTFRYDQLVSTMPLPVLIRLMGEEAPHEVQEAAAGLRYVSVRCVNLGVGRPNLTEKHWIYYPEETIFHRIFVQGNASPHCNPPGGFGLTCEITYSEHKPLPCDGGDLIARCVDDCHKVGLFGPDDPVLVANQVDMPFAYVVYDHDRPKRVNLIRGWLERQDIALAGRYSEWEYYNSDHAFLAGKRAADGWSNRLGDRAAADDRPSRALA